MEYDAPTPLGYGSAARDTPRPADLPSLRAQLEDCVGRAREIAARVEGVGDLVFGPRPETPAGLNKVSGSPTIAELVNELDMTLSRVGSALNRL